MLAKKHDIEIALHTPAGDRNEFITCEQCQRHVKRKNLKKHIKRIHINGKSNTNGKRVQAKSKKSKIEPLPRFKLTSKDARKMRRIRENVEAHFTRDKEVSEYLKSHPLKDGMGKFGVPQDKYRWGFYGSRSMEYDTWGRGS